MAKASRPAHPPWLRRAHLALLVGFGLMLLAVVVYLRLLDGPA